MLSSVPKAAPLCSSCASAQPAFGMATPSYARVTELHKQAMELSRQLRSARAAEIFGRAVAAAQALSPDEDCLVVAWLRFNQVTMLVAHSGAAPERIKSAENEAFLVLLPAVRRSLERRRAAGTLLAGAARPYELRWAASVGVEDTASWAYHMFLAVANITLETSSFGGAAATQPDLLKFVASAVNLVLDAGSASHAKFEPTLVRDYRCPCLATVGRHDSRSRCCAA